MVFSCAALYRNVDGRWFRYGYMRLRKRLMTGWLVRQGATC
jgi:hypothetical protein